jgi:Na+/melibiose symporter-like transporter
MFTFPLFVFYFFFLVVFKEDKDKLGWCGMAAVVAANIVIVSYVWMAWNEDRDVSPDSASSTQKQPVKEKKTRSD